MNGKIVIVGDFNIGWLNTMDLSASGFIIFLKLMDLFKIYELKHTKVIIYLIILLQDRIVILYQISPSRISSQIIGYPIQFEIRMMH